MLSGEIALKNNHYYYFKTNINCLLCFNIVMLMILSVIYHSIYNACVLTIFCAIYGDYVQIHGFSGMCVWVGLRRSHSPSGSNDVSRL